MDLDKDKNIVFSSKNYDSCKQPFFIQNSEMEITDYKNNINNNDQDIFYNLDLENIPDFLISFYKTINCIDREFYINDWTFLSFNKIITIKTEYIKDNIQAIDIAFTYLGMGHILLAFYDSKTEKIKLRYDGGSNGYDREANYLALKNYYNNISNEFSSNDSFNTLDELIDYIKKYQNDY